MDRLLELEPGQPPAMQPGPGRPTIVASMTQQEPGELLARPAQAVHRVEPCPYQIAHRLVSDIRNPYRGQFAGPVQLGRPAASRRSVLTRSPARFGISEGATTTHSCPRVDKRRWMPYPQGPAS